jgi:SAM-dependent methyltransferase
MSATPPRTFDPIWEEKYRSGHRQRYPWDSVVTFVFRNAPRDRARADVRVMEVGCGTGSNLWFAAREGFQVAGVDASASAIEAARATLADEGLQGDLRVADFVSLPFPRDWADLAIDRGALTCCGREAARRAVAEVRRVLRPGGRFLFNPYADDHTSAGSGVAGPDGVVLDIRAGTLVGAGQICFYGWKDVEEALGPGWSIKSADHVQWEDRLAAAPSRHAEWRVVAEKA